MNLQEIIKLNQKYDLEYKKLSKLQQELINDIRITNQSIDFDEVRLLSYEEVKSIHKLIYWNLEDEQRKVFTQIMTELKEAQYPILKKAHYYPVINEIDFLPDDRKVELDKLLSKLYNHYIYTNYGAWFKLNLSNEETEKVMNFLHEKGIIAKTYAIDCDCSDDDNECTPEILTQADYDLFIKLRSVSDEEISKLSNEEKLKYYDDCWNHGYIEVGCWNGDGKEIYDLETFLKEVRLFYYKNVTKPDTSLDNV